MGDLFINGDSLTTADVFKACNDSLIKVRISDEVKNKIVESKNLLDSFIDEHRVIYGVNTGVGGFVNWLIPQEGAEELQNNLIEAVATNVGPYLEDTIVRATILIRLNSLSRGTSAISLDNFNKLLLLFNSGIVPCIPAKGSLGASGDLGPLAYIALVATGKWRARYKGELLPGDLALQKAGIEPMSLSFKEGLSLINGTSAMAAMAAILVENTMNLVKLYDVISSLSFEALNAKKKPFDPKVHKQKPHLGQQNTAINLWAILKDSKMIADEDAIEKKLHSLEVKVPTAADMPIEDAYSIRCSPQILGPIKDSVRWIKQIVENEMNSSNDNPLVLPEYKDVFHNGHFHGQYISMAMDYLSICLTSLSNLSDRRIDRFMDKNHSNGLPPFLCDQKSGLRLGLMGGQFMSTSLTAENRSLCLPLSTQTLTSTGDFQDIVSMGLIAARRATELFHNTVYIVAFELLCAAQGAEIRGADQLSSSTKELFKQVRLKVPYLDHDRSITDYLESLALMIKSHDLVASLSKFSGNLLI
ncbi:MAG: phenylalanine aminomutase (D-beta-phenylalanine forming) [Rhabdochlamydiaceae bacterium]|nr:phenylalanine aminomutase (D-beta-phenylalanine forming) [Rhabdochlamydiaceae bacterium]